MSYLTVWPILLPLIAAFVVLLSKSGGIKLQRLISLLSVIGLIVINFSLIKEAASGSYQVYLLGNWQAPFGIVLVLDQLSALLLIVTSILATAALIYAIATNTDQQGSHFHALFLLILFGLNGAFLTGDVFNLFVFFEVLLLASYGLLLHGGGRQRTKAGLHYVIINLVGATLFLFAVGTLYGVLGTLNIADMAAKVALLNDDDAGLVAAAGLLLLLVFSLKAALFPLYLWMPTAYTHTSAAVATLFAIMTKVGIYAIIRVHGTIFGETAGNLAFYYMPWILGLGLLTLLLAAFGVMSARSLREQVAYLVLASVATLLIALGINSELSLSAGLYYLIHSTLIAGGMFMLADIIARSRGTVADSFVSSQAIPRAILLGSLFMFAAVAMTGMPPLSGFFGKVLILNAALNHQWMAAIFSVVLLSGFIMILSMARTGSLLFYQVLADENTDDSLSSVAKPVVNRLSIFAVIMLFISSPILVILAQPITAYTESTAKQQFNSQAYIQAVLSTPSVQRSKP